ncbi:hypothetical protein ONV78_04885 [Hahella sp. CR1]|uniref:hypothetical protein n=1 Tax=Hahella sp. CR1 TaxID=2992807 RepID=UPI002440F0A1|nr:hypothetical protein [Hahella sp. CR1]MDG9667063.1 hypothetical protein [Hahella sp. CR1]
MRENQKKKSEPTVSRRLSDGGIVEMVYRSSERRTELAIWDGNQVTYQESLSLPNGETLVPIKGSNNLIRHKAILLPERAKEYGTTKQLLDAIRSYIDRYVHLSDQFRSIAPIYVLLSWVSDAFNEVPYLRFRGDFGSGKTRALQVLGSILYKPFFASGASTLSPLFHTLDLFRGSLVFDETDFRYSDERSDIVKIFNNGTSRGLPVLRTIVNKDNEYNPRAFSVFGPKIVAMRRNFSDEALESRFITEEMGTRPLRLDIPISLPNTYKDEAKELRNMLLMYRFRNMQAATSGHTAAYSTSHPTLSARTQQMLLPLLSLAQDEEAKDHILDVGRVMDERIQSLRSRSHEAMLLPILASFMYTEQDIPIQQLTAAFIEKHDADIDRPITSRYVGSLVRTRLYLPTYKRHGVFVIPVTEKVKEQVHGLCVRYGVGKDSAASDRS